MWPPQHPSSRQIVLGIQCGTHQCFISWTALVFVIYISNAVRWFIDRVLATENVLLQITLGLMIQYSLGQNPDENICALELYSSWQESDYTKFGSILLIKGADTPWKFWLGRNLKLNVFTWTHLNLWAQNQVSKQTLYGVNPELSSLPCCLHNHHYKRMWFVSHKRPWLMTRVR